MVSTAHGFDEALLLHDLKHYLPAQNPLKDFVHHNTLHAFQNKDFFEALQLSSQIFGYKTYLPLSEYKTRFSKGEIKENSINYVVNNFTEDTVLWKEKMFSKNYDESVHPRIGKLRKQWKQHYGINLDKMTFGILFKVLCGYLDQGISMNPFPVQADSFLTTIQELQQNSIGFLQSKLAKDLLKKKASIAELLKLLVGDEKYYYRYVFDQQFSHSGWSGMVAVIEKNPATLLEYKPITLKELIQFELLLEIDALEKKFKGQWKPLGSTIQELIEPLFTKNTSIEYFQVLALWQQAFEWTHYNQVLTTLQKAPKAVSVKKPSFQSFFCMDDREGSLRRHIEQQDDKAVTYGTAAFFNFEFYYKPISGKFYTKSCPGTITPKYLIKEKGRQKKQAKDLHYHKESHSLFFGWIISQTLGFISALKLFVNIFKPTISPATTVSFKHLHSFANLMIENTNPNQKEDDLQLGFTVQEMADRVEALLKSNGLINNFAPIVYLVGHGATSVNNTHYAGYDCGACCGRPSSVNAKVACYAANHTGVRTILKERGIYIPIETQFVPALHDTTRDEIKFYDEDVLIPVNQKLHEANKQVFLQALEKNAVERSRRFETLEQQLTCKKAHDTVKLRSVSLFEPRPEMNHATNSICIVGRRDLTKNISFDRRAFLNSYDYQVDTDGKYLTTILGAVAPVGGGINLEYYFSRVDNQKLGAGSKLPHNVMGLLGVANGVDGDLRPGLPIQMTEVHDPVRLLVVVEHFPEIVLQAIKANSQTYEWFKNQWVKLVVVHPKTYELFHFQNENFTNYQPFDKEIYSMDELWKHPAPSNQNMPISIIN